VFFIIGLFLSLLRGEYRQFEQSIAPINTARQISLSD
jgi:hypothetical protein